MKKSKNEKRDTPHKNTDPDFMAVQNRAIDKSNKQANAEQTLADRLEYEQEIQQAYISCFRSPAGEIVLKHLEKICRYKQSCFVPDSIRHTDFNLGRQAIIIAINETIKGNE